MCGVKEKTVYVSLIWGHLWNIFCLSRNPCNLSRTYKKKPEGLGFIPKPWWQKQITIWTLQGMALSGCLINCIYMQITVASVCGQFDRLCLDCIHGQEAPSSPGSERQQAVIDFYGQLRRLQQRRTMECINRSQAKIWHSCIREQKFAVATFQLSSIVCIWTNYVCTVFFQVMWVSKTQYKFGNELYNILNLVTT